MHARERRTEHVGGAHKLDDLRQGGAQVVALDLLLQSGGAQQRVLHVQGCQGEAPPLHLTHQGHQALQACPQRCACIHRHPACNSVSRAQLYIVHGAHS